MKKTLLFTLAVTVLFMGSVVLLATERTDEPIKPVPLNLKFDKAKVELGKMLYFDPRLSKSGFISCHSCHNLSLGGADNRVSSIGHKWQRGPINSPTVLNSRYNFSQFWDGRAKDLKEQAGGPIENPKEMGFSHELAVTVISSIPDYVNRVKKVYKSDKVTIDHITDAIAAFEETLVTPNSPFDKWLRGDDKALSKIELEGYNLFKENMCDSCHAGVGVGGESYEKFGIDKPYEKDTLTIGRMGVTEDEADKYSFKVPLLRNIELTAPYFHDGSTWNLAEAVKIMGEYQYGLEINDNDAAKIVAFMRTLTGEMPEITIPLLPPSTDSTPLPNMN